MCFMSPSGKTLKLPHRRWATRLPVENTQAPQGSIDRMNREEMVNLLAR